MAGRQQNFEPYWSKGAVNDGLERGSLIRGPIKINPKTFVDAYVPHPDGKSSVYIKGVKARNRALNSDIVVVLIYPHDQSRSDSGDYERPKLSRNASGSAASTASKKPTFVQMTGKVVYIAEKKHSRTVSGQITPMENDKKKAKFLPTDSRVPRMFILMKDCPKDFLKRSDDFTNTLFIARIEEWDENSKVPRGTLARCLGETGEIEPEKLKDILIEMGVDDSSVSEENFEPYWSQEAVNNGLERGSLINGPLKIHHKSYKDAYVPHPDGKTDVYIKGTIDRNRALNSDIVVVLIYPYDKWRVSQSDFQDYERSLLLGDEIPRKGGTALSSTGTVRAAMGKLDISSGKAKSVAASTTRKTSDTLLSNRGSQAKQKVQEALKKRGSSPQKFCSVSDMMKSGSPLAKNLFGNGPGYQTQIWDEFVQRTGKVVYIAEKKHSRTVSGQISPMGDSKKKAKFLPTDSRVPRMFILMKDCPKGFLKRPDDFTNTLFIAHIEQWDENMKMPRGTLTKRLGEAGQIEPETMAMLVDMDVDYSRFSEEVNQCLPTNLPWQIPEAEFAYRKDLRKSFVFTIDPPASRDVDDAMSIEQLPDGKYSVGVHIADVSFFVKEYTALDEVAAKRANSVYLEHEVVIPMLPHLLSEDLASLNPDQDRLTFSVIWTISENGKIYNEWYGRSVIRSCVKLSYDHAQGFIDQPEKEWRRKELPPITNGFDVKDVMKRVLQLNKIAINLRKQRIGHGALMLQTQVRLQYEVDTETGIPKYCSVYQQMDSHRLIEEFMLLANMAVAHKIKNSFPDKAILIQHPSPQKAVEELCDSLGLSINATTTKNLQRSMDGFGQDKCQVLVALLSKRMQTAKCICSGTYPDASLHHHYALNVPQYTHFTSPIRRYSDVLVHRLLAASLGYCSPPRKSTEQLQRQADYCNDRELIAKKASKQSSDMYFTFFVKEVGPLEVTGMVMAVQKESFDVLILKLGVVKRVYLGNLPLLSSKLRKNVKCPELVIEWAADEKCYRKTKHCITLFTLVNCCVFVDKDKELLRWWTKSQCVIRRPEDEIEFKSMASDDDDDDDDDDDYVDDSDDDVDSDYS